MHISTRYDYEETPKDTLSSSIAFSSSGSVPTLYRKNVSANAVSPHTNNPTPTIPVASKQRGFMGEKQRGFMAEFFSDVRGYFKDNRDLILTVALVLVIDEFVFDGAFRDRIKKLVNGMLKKAQSKLGVGADAAV